MMQAHPPISPGELPGPQQQGEQPSLSSLPSTAGSRAHVLVTEDDPQMGLMIAAALEKTYRVTTASDGQEGLEQALALRPDVILCDVSMPRLSGEQLVAALRGRPDFDDVPIVVLSGRTDERLRIQLLRAGAQDYLLKPFHHEELRVRIANLLSMRQVRQILQREVADQSQDLASLAREITMRQQELMQAHSLLQQHEACLQEQADQLERRNRELERLNQDLWQQQDKLAQVNAALEEANLARSQFLSTMSHELRTPLASIIGFGEILLDDAREAAWEQQQQSALEKILTNSEHLLELINDVLDLSKIEAGRMLLDYRQVHPGELLGEVAAEIGSLATKRNLFLRMQVEEGIGCLESNPAKLHQVLLNLVSNALKFTEHGGVTLSASRALLSATGVEGIAFAVQDSGIGIPADLQERIFEAFYQVDMSYTRKVGGTGLGLSIVSQLTALLGGTITVASAPAQGSTFTVTLPLKAAPGCLEQNLPRLHAGQPQKASTIPPAARQLVPAPSPETLAEPGKPEAAAGQDALILVVDDNPETIVVVRKALQDTPYTLIGVQDPLMVMELTQEMHPCAITLDVMMPQLNGWQLLHQLKDNPATASIPVVMLTVLSEKTTGYVLGADDYLIKPFKKEVLRSTLERIIAASKREMQAVASED